jgi:hypothetical protein
MRIAICISGHLENWESKYDNWKNLFFKIISSSNYINTNSSFDIFVHTWDFDITPNGEVVNIHNSKLLDFQNFIKPIDIKIDNYAKYSSRGDTLTQFKHQHFNSTEQPSLLVKYGPELYGIMMAAHIKRNYEIVNNFEYDMCFRLSTDVDITDNIASTIIDNFKITNDKHIHMANVIKTFEFPYDVVNYDLFFANSQTFDIICSMYNIIPLLKTEHFPKNISINYMFGYFLRMFDIKINRLNIITKNIKTNLI